MAAEATNPLKGNVVEKNGTSIVDVTDQVDRGTFSTFLVPPAWAKRRRPDGFAPATPRNFRTPT